MYIFKEDFIEVQGELRLPGLSISDATSLVPEKVFSGVQDKLCDLQKDGWEVLALTRVFAPPGIGLTLLGYNVILRKPCP